MAETATLLLSELVTNAYRHGKAPAGREIWVRCYVTPARLRVEVLDANATLPAPLPALPEAEAGRGLLLVAALADAWGAEGRACGVGKTVWFELALT